MIYDKLANMNLYKGLYPNLDLAIDYIANNDLSKLEVGKHEIAGKDVYVSVIELTGKAIATTPFEIHKKYLDIHVDITGCEIIETGDMGHGTETSFDEGRDFGIVECENKVTTHLCPEDFYICMLDEPHKPACADGTPSTIKKCIFKVLV